MRARCVGEQPTTQQQELLGRHFKPGQTAYPVVQDKEYVVLGVGFWNSVVWYEIAASSRTLVSVPAFLFELVDAKPSRHWQGRLRADSSFTLWPPSFYHEHYHDDVSEGVPEAVDDLAHLRQLLESEAGAQK